MNIVFVCTGNTCRSPMAEAIFREKTKDFSENITVSSCGLGALPGDAASENSVTVMAETGIDISSHRARQINEYIIDESDFIICLSDSHYNYLTPFCKEKLVLLGDGIPDPYGGSVDEYRYCRDEIESAIDILLESDTFIKIDKMCSDDAQAAYVIEKDNFSDPWSVDSFLSQFDKSFSVNIVAKYLGKIIGYICCDDIMGEVYICTVAVDKSFRRRGIGRKLIDSVIDYCIENNSEMLTLEVRVSNTPAISLYSSFGFKNLGIRKNFYSKPAEDAYIMTKYFNGDNNENISY